MVVASLFQSFLERNRRRNCRRPRRALPLSLSVSRSSFVRAEGGKERVEGKIGSIEIERQGRGRINGGGGGKGATRGQRERGREARRKPWRAESTWAAANNHKQACLIHSTF